MINTRSLFVGSARLLAPGVVMICTAHLAVPLRGQTWQTCPGTGSTLCTTSSDKVGLGYAGGGNTPYSLLNLFNGSMSIIGGVTQVQVGGAASPSYQFLGSSNAYNTGMYSPNNGIGFSVSGVERLRIDTNGNVGIGTTSPTPGHLLSVAGAIGAREVVVQANEGADYVFEPAYRLKSLGEIAAFVNEHHHLPEIPAAAEMQERGVNVGEMQMKLLAKIEELTLHLVQADEKIRELQNRISRLDASNAKGEAK